MGKGGHSGAGVGGEPASPSLIPLLLSTCCMLDTPWNGPCHPHANGLAGGDRFTDKPHHVHPRQTLALNSPTGLGGCSCIFVFLPQDFVGCL